METARVDLNGRVYDPTVGRMISADPTVPDALYSQAFNRYSYVNNSPLENIDPSGFDEKPKPCPKPAGTSSENCQGSSGSGSGGNGGNGGSSGHNGPPETGSHIPGVNTGATCAGNCSGWTDFGPGPNGPGNGDEGSGPCEGGAGNCALDSTGGGENADPANNLNTAQLGGIQVNGHRLPTPPPQPYFENNWQYDQSMLQISLLQGLTPMGGQSNADPVAVQENSKWRYAGALATTGPTSGTFVSNQYLLIVAQSQEVGLQGTGFYAEPFDLDQNGNPISNVYDPSQTSWYHGINSGLGYSMSVTLDAGPNPFGTGYMWIVSIPLQEDTNGNPGTVTLLIYTQSPPPGGGH